VNASQRYRLIVAGREYDLGRYTSVNKSKSGTVSSDSEPWYLDKNVWSETKNETVYQEPSCIRYLDLRRGTVYFAHGSKLHTTYIASGYADYNHFITDMTSETDRVSLWAKLTDHVAPKVQLYAPTSWSDTPTSTSTDVFYGGPNYDFGSDRSEHRTLVETDFDQSSLLASSYFYYNVPYPMGPSETWWMASRGAHVIAYSCANDRAIALQKLVPDSSEDGAQWAAFNYQKQLYASVTNSVVPWESFVTLEANDSTFFASLAPSNLSFLVET
jgi:hypothetical protein